MKFCKNLQRVVDISDPEWSPYWVNYKMLKVRPSRKTQWIEHLMKIRVLSPSFGSHESPILLWVGENGGRSSVSPVFPRRNVALKPAVDSEAIVLHWRRLTFGGVQTRRWFPSFQHLFLWRHKIQIESNLRTCLLCLVHDGGKNLISGAFAFVIFRGGKHNWWPFE